ncbi:MAG: OmpW/AlkL family protein [Polaromonas sp.]
MKSPSSFFLFASVLAAVSSAPALAQQNTLKLGISHVRPQSSASDFSGAFTPRGISLDVLDNSTAFISYTRELNERWDVELALGAPPTHDIALKVNNPTLTGSVQALNQRIGAQVRQVASTVFVNYKFLHASSALRPFVGAGVNYTRFDKARSNAAGNALNGGATSISLEDSVGLALQAGLAWRLDSQWSVSAALATAQVQSKVTTNTLGIERSADITFRPQVFVVAAGYSF